MEYPIAFVAGLCRCEAAFAVALGCGAHGLLEISVKAAQRPKSAAVSDIQYGGICVFEQIYRLTDAMTVDILGVMHSRELAEVAGQIYTVITQAFAQRIQRTIIGVVGFHKLDDAV